MKVFDCGTLIDGVEDEPLTDGQVIVDDGEIVEYGTQEEMSAPVDAERIDCSNQVVMPGMIETHVHLHGVRMESSFARIQATLPAATARATMDLRTLLNAGFTTIRDVGSQTGIGLRQAVEEEEIPGPRIFTSGLRFCQTGGHGDIHELPHKWINGDDYSYTYTKIVDGADNCRLETRKSLRNGADLVKILTTGGVLSKEDDPNHAHYTDDEIRAFTEEAARWGAPVSAHAQSPAGIRAALRNGVKTIDHGFFIDEESLSMLQEENATVVPTMSVLKKIVEDGPEYGIPEYGLRKANKTRDAHIRSIKKVYEAGVPIALGTDMNGSDLFPHGDNLLELQLYVEEVGMDEMDAVKTATSNAAKTLPVDDVGSIQPGNRADLVVLDDDPLVDITNLTAVDTVYKNGQQVDV